MLRINQPFRWSLKLVFTFLCQGDPNLKTLWAAEKGETEILEQLLEGDNSLVHSRDPDGYTPLHRAAYEGHLHCAKVR